MKNNILLVGFILISYLAGYGQSSPTLNQRKAAAEAIYNVFNDYMLNADFKELGQSGYSDNKINKFIALCDSGAMIHDDISPASQIDLSTADKNLSQYVSDLKLNFPEGLAIRLLRSNISLNNLSQKKASFVIERSISGKYKTGFLYQDKQSVMIISLALADDYQSAKISGISRVSGNLQCVDCPPPVAANNKPGKDTVIAVNVVHKEKKPAGEKGGVGVALAINVSAPGNVGVGPAPDLNKLNYNPLFKDSTTSSGFKRVISTSASAGLDVDLMFGKKKNIGLGVGLLYNYSGITIRYDNYRLFYGATNPYWPSVNSGLNNFLRIYTPRNVNEKISTSSVGLNLLLKCQGDGNGHVGYYFHIGPTIMLYSTAHSSYSATVDYAANYILDANGYALPPDGTIHTSDVIHLEPHSIGQDVNYNESASGKSESINYKIGIGGIVRGGVSIALAKQVNLLVGADFMIFELSGNNKLNTSLPDNIWTGKYNTVLYAVDKMTNVNMGLHLGLVFKFFKPAEK